jgi:hypothetical protein
MIAAAVVEAFIGVRAEQRSLESISTPLSASDLEAQPFRPA